MKERIPPLLKEDRNLPFLDMAWSCSKMADLFNRHVLPAVRPGQEARAVTIEDMTYAPEKQCHILYSLQFNEPSGDPGALALVTFARDHTLEETYTRHYGGDTSRAVFLPEYGCLVELFPADWKLPSLARAMDREEAALLLAQIETRASSSVRSETKVLRYRPRQRCVLRYVLRSSDDDVPQEVIAKVYPQGPKPGRAWRAQNTLYSAAPEGLIIPRPLGLIDGWNLVLMECVPGTPMKQVLEEGATARGPAREATRLAARALVSLHRMSYVDASGNGRTLQSQLELLRDRTAPLHCVAPALARQVDGFVDGIARLAQRFHLDTLSCIHGECKASQFLVDHAKVAIVDFDRVCLGDAAVDVGNFMASLHRGAVQGKEYFRELATDFMIEYAGDSRRNGLVERARLFQAAALVQMAVRSFTRSPYAYSSAGTDALPALLLEEAAACLAAL
jgi:aminoglycoside phosphotransferase (APT) family kinase protein